jgi:tryptophanyl-tRNA synthetase
MSEFKKLVFSGVQPTGNLHLGNYLGAIRRFVALQEGNDCIYCVVDMHALTAQLVHEDMPSQTRSIAAAFIAAGIDPEKHIVFNQSAVPQHAELAWIFNCVARIGWMNRMTQFKDKAGKDREQASLGLYAYPSLMAADILVYAEHISRTGYGVDITVGNEPVHAYFPMVEPLIGGPAPRVMSLRDGTKKMSKSDPSDLSRINLMDDEDAISKKIRKAKTDPDGLPSEIDGLQGRPEADNLVAIYAALADKSKADVLAEFGGQQFSIFKPALVELAINVLAPITGEMRRLMDDTSHIDAILRKGGERARARAEVTMRQVRDIIGFLY